MQTALLISFPIQIGSTSKGSGFNFTRILSSRVYHQKCSLTPEQTIILVPFMTKMLVMTATTELTTLAHITN